MSRRIIAGLLLVIYSLTIVSGEDSVPSVVGRPARSLPQRIRCATKKDFDFVTEYKRLPEHRYVTEYKRFPEYRYSFGIGKRWFDDTKRNLPYSFGVGKRSQLEKLHPMKFLSDYLSIDNDNYFANNLLDSSEIKRAAPLRSYDFGIGKRNKITREELDLMQPTIDDIDDQPEKYTNNNQEIPNSNLKIQNDDVQVWQQY